MKNRKFILKTRHIQVDKGSNNSNTFRVLIREKLESNGYTKF
jgi:hypothetical protein